MPPSFNELDNLSSDDDLPSTMQLSPSIHDQDYVQHCKNQMQSPLSSQTETYDQTVPVMLKNKSNCSVNCEYKYSTIPDDRGMILRLPISVSYTMSNIYYYRVHRYFIPITIGRLQSHGTLLKYPVQKHEADSLFALYQKTVEEEYKNVMEKYLTLYRVSNFDKTKRRHGSDSLCTPKRHKSHN